MEEERKYIPKPTFMNILKTGGAVGQSFTMSEMLTHLISYIKLKKICNPENVLNVNCEQDELHSVFGVLTFTRSNVELVLTNIFVVHLWNSIFNEERLSKMNYLQHYHPLYISVDEGIFDENLPQGYEDYETDVIQDSSDDRWTASESEIDLDSVRATSYEVEFEVNETDGSTSEPDTDSDIEMPSFLKYIWVIRWVSSAPTSIAATMANLNQGGFLVLLFIPLYSVTIPIFHFGLMKARTEEGSNDSDFNDPDLCKDFWICDKCKIRNKPISRNCLKCWKVRKNWLPDKTTRKTKKLKKRKSRQKYVKMEQSSPEDGSSTQDSQDSLSDIVNNSINQKEDASSLCMICLQRPKSATLVHGRTGHQLCMLNDKKKGDLKDYHTLKVKLNTARMGFS
ncbi:E3 ubiquitin-protein ligase Mdm2 [Nymphon striatum]|nr:E3 ubiquitin-protein ligase Mdm2 [Nymphon striatum]